MTTQGGVNMKKVMWVVILSLVFTLPVLSGKNKKEINFNTDFKMYGDDTVEIYIPKGDVVIQKSPDDMAHIKSFVFVDSKSERDSFTKDVGNKAKNGKNYSWFRIVDTFDDLNNNWNCKIILEIPDGKKIKIVNIDNAVRVKNMSNSTDVEMSNTKLSTPDKL